MSRDIAAEDFTLAELRRATQLSREFSVPLGEPAHGRSANLRLPTQYELRVAGLRAGVGQMDPAWTTLVQRALLVGGVVAWANVMQSDVLPDAPAEPLPLRPAAVEMLLDAHPEWESALGTQLWSRLHERDEKKAQAEKN